tara:strand:+ start:3545 stop:3811 length:267 start_codon:yes stop_codon:yes gene_type:complete
MKILIKMRCMSTSKGFFRNGDIIELPDAEVKKILAGKPLAIEVLPEPKPKLELAKKVEPKLAEKVEPAPKRVPFQRTVKAKDNVKPVH